MNTYHLWAEHTSGASVGHPCTTGIYSDPTDRWSDEVEAENEEAAMKLGHSLLAKIVAEYEPCKCQRHLQPGWDSWWNSVSITASRAAYPKYVSDEDAATVCGNHVQHDNSGVGHNWRNIDRDDIPANIVEELEGEMIDGGKDECADFVASNGQHYRW